MPSANHGNEYCDRSKSHIVIIPAPYDKTSTWVKGADKGINLNNGWNLIGHPYLQEKNVLELFENATLYLYNGSWSSYIPGRAFNSLQKLKPGYGYWVRNDE